VSLKSHLPNSSKNLFALVLRRDVKRPFVYYPVRFYQIVGGRTWSLAIIRNVGAEHILPAEELDEIQDSTRSAG
jgi:hypothetical protein